MESLLKRRLYPRWKKALGTEAASQPRPCGSTTTDALCSSRITNRGENSLAWLPLAVDGRICGPVQRVSTGAGPRVMGLAPRSELIFTGSDDGTTICIFRNHVTAPCAHSSRTGDVHLEGSQRAMEELTQELLDPIHHSGIQVVSEIRCGEQTRWTYGGGAVRSRRAARECGAWILSSMSGSNCPETAVNSRS